VRIAVVGLVVAVRAIEGAIRYETDQSN